MGVYVYGVVRAGGAAHDAPAVRAIECGGLSALVSDVPDKSVRIRKDSLLAHDEVLREAMQAGPVLPMRFGVVMPDEAAVERTLLAARAPELAARLDALEGKVEMQVKATYAEEPLLRSILAREPEAAALARRVRGLPAEASHFDRIRLGELIAAAVQARRELSADELIAAVSPLAAAVSLGDPLHERMALNAAFLVERERAGDFDGAVARFAAQRAGELELKLIGPLPPYSFTERENAWG